MPAADLYKPTVERSAGRREAVELVVRGAEPVPAEPPPVPSAVQAPVEGAPPPVPQPAEGEDEVLPDRALNLDGIAPPPVVKLHKRLARRSETLKLHLKHCLMSSVQFSRCTSELYLPEGVYRLYDSAVADCGICQKTKSAPPRSRFSGVRAKGFADIVFMDHCEIEHVTKKH